MSITVTATQGGSGAHAGTILSVKVLTGQAASPAGAAAQSLTALDASVTPHATGSFIYGACADNADDASLTAVSGTTIGTQVNAAGFSGAVFRKTATTTGGSPATVGTTTGFPLAPVCALLEILAGSGLAEDASSPAVASSGTATTETTASFSPPAGAMLIAMVAAGNNGTGTTTVTVTDSSGLTWTQQEVANGAGLGHASVWTAVLGTVVALSPATRARAAQAVTPAALSGTVSISPARRARAAQPLAVSAGTVTTALSPATRARAAQPAGPRAISPFPRDPLAILVEALIGDTWTDITSFVYGRDPITLTRGRPDESAFVNPSTLTMTLNNRDNRFSYRNAAGPWYGLIGKNTQVRLSVQAANPDDSTRARRYWGELAEVPYARDATDTDRWVQVQVGGILRRLQQQGALGTSPAPLPLPLAAFYASLAGTSLAFTMWWPCTDPAGSTQFASGIPGGQVMSFTGTPGLAGSTAFPGSAAIATFSKSAWTGLLAGTSVSPGTTSTITDTFNSSTFWQAPPGTTVLLSVKSTGPGGAGSAGTGGGVDDAGAGGGGGGVSTRTNVAVTPGSFYEAIAQAGLDASFAADSVTVTGGKGASASGTSGGDGGSGDNPGGKGGDGFANDAIGAGGGGAGGGDGAPSGELQGSGAGGSSGLGGAGGQGGINANSNGSAGQFPGGGGGGASEGSSGSGGPGGGPQVVIKYQQSGGGNVSVTGGPQNANVFRFLLSVPAAGDTDGGEIALMTTSGDVVFAQMFYHRGIGILSAALGAGPITSIAVVPVPEDIPSGTVVTVTGSDGQQQFTTTADAPTGSSSLSVSSATPTITTAAGNPVTKGADATGYLQLFLLAGDGTRLLDTGLKAFGADGSPMLVSVELAQSGADINWTFQALHVGSRVPVAFTGTLTTAAVGSVGAIQMNRTGELDGTAAGQVTVQYATSDITTLADPLDAWDGEAAGRRFLRLCTQEGVGSEIAGDPDATVAMGIQSSDTFVNLLQTVENADRGQVYESRNLLGLGYRTRASLQSQAPLIVADYASQVLPSDPPLVPLTDDQYTANDVIVQRDGGSQAEAIQQDGPLSVLPPPNGVGPYTATVQEVLQADGQLRDAAGWLLHLGTSPDYRFPAISLRMERHQVTDAGLWAPVAVSDIGCYVQILNPPPDLSPDPVRQIVLGFTETFSNNDSERTWTLQLNCVPEAPYETAVAGSATFRADTSGSTLHAALDSTTGTFEVDTTAAGSALWDTAGGDDPFDIVLAGERMTVTGITGSASPQSFTVTRSVNGIVKAHTAGEAVALFFPPIASI